MKINLNHYIVGKVFIQEWFLRKAKDEPGYAVSLLAVSTHTPAVVVAFFISEVDNWSPETIKIIDDLTKFYGYKEIIGVPEGYPGKKL